MNILYKFRYLLLLPILLLIVFVGSKMISGVVIDPAFNYEREWSVQGGVDAKQDWDDAVSRARLGMAIDPLNPNYPELLGRLHFWRFFIQDAPIQSYEQA